MNIFYTKDYSDSDCRQILEEIYSGARLVLPVSMDHAKFMSCVAQHYIDSRHQQTFDALKKTNYK